MGLSVLRLDSGHKPLPGESLGHDGLQVVKSVRRKGGRNYKKSVHCSGKNKIFNTTIYPVGTTPLSVGLMQTGLRLNLRINRLLQSKVWLHVHQTESDLPLVLGRLSLLRPLLDLGEVSACVAGCQVRGQYSVDAVDAVSQWADVACALYGLAQAINAVFFDGVSVPHAESAGGCVTHPNDENWYP